MDSDIKLKIMDTAMRLMEKKDMNSISIREIAKEADINIASISYYFGGKAQLFHKMMERYWAEMIDIYQLILNDTAITRDKAEEYCIQILRFEMKSTGVLRSEQVMYQQYGVDEATKSRLKLQFQAMAYLVIQCNPQINKNLVIHKVLSLLSSLTCPSFWSEMTGTFVEDPKSFEKIYVKELVRVL